MAPTDGRPRADAFIGLHDQGEPVERRKGKGADVFPTVLCAGNIGTPQGQCALEKFTQMLALTGSCDKASLCNVVRRDTAGLQFYSLLNFAVDHFTPAYAY
jgi:hypothetical protein